MPTYLMKHIETGEEMEVIVSISKMEQMKTEGWTQIHKSTAEIISQHGSTLNKTSGDWKDLIKTIKKGSGRGNSINT